MKPLAVREAAGGNEMAGAALPTQAPLKSGYFRVADVALSEA